jgi:hypothetical protein
MAVDAAARDGTRRRKSRREAAAVQRFPREEEEVVGASGDLAGRRGLNLTAPGYREGAWGSILPGRRRLTTPAARGKWSEPRDGAIPCCTPQQ